MPPDAPWRDAAVLRALAADWSRRFAGRAVARLCGGPGWIHLTFAARGDAAVHVLWTARPGATLLCDDTQPPPAAVTAALGRQPRHPLAPRLLGARCTGAAAYAGDLAIALSFAARGQASPLRLVHQLFGSRGNLVLADADGRLHWSAHPSPHPALLDPPAAPAADATPDADAGAAAAAACRAAAATLLPLHLETELGARLGRTLRQAQEAATRLRDNLARDLAGADRGDDLRRDAQALAAHLTTVPRGAAQVVLADPAGGADRTVTLDPALTPAANLEDYFRRARKAARGRAVIAQRLEEVQRRLAALTDARASLNACLAGPAPRLEACLAWCDTHRDLLGPEAALDPPPRETPEPPRPFRRFRLEERWEVWLGRNNAENDELTLRAAAPDDIWLHAQGVPGSHAVLRTGGRPDGVPRRILEKAAALAALHSRARDAALVPVVYTLRKYVRKPRRSPPGTVVHEREKTLFVPPIVPEGTQPV